jgi:hypothetical protein
MGRGMCGKVEWTCARGGGSRHRSSCKLHVVSAWIVPVPNHSSGLHGMVRAGMVMV